MDIILKTRTFVSDSNFWTVVHLRREGFLKEHSTWIPFQTVIDKTHTITQITSTHVFPSHLQQMCLDLIYLSVLTGGNNLVVCEMRSNQCSRHFCKLHLLVDLEWPVEEALGQSGGLHPTSQKCSVKCEWQQHGERFHGCHSGFSRKGRFLPWCFVL